MKNLICLTVIFMSVSIYIQAQKQEPEYINYQTSLNVIAEFVKSADTTLWKQAMNTLHGTARSLKEETVVNLPITDKAAGRKQLSDESVYATKKSSILTVGRLRITSGTNVNVDILGTASLISKEGHCLTNYHVLESLFQQKPDQNDLAYFVITEDKRVYVINQLFTYSRNNDLAIFSLAANGRQFNYLAIGKPAVVGAPVYCISHPAGELYYFSKGMVARNIARDSATLGTAYSAAGNLPIRMEISADFGGGSSGGPVLDKYGNLIGIIATTNTIYLHEMQNDGIKMHPQMVIKSTIPVKALKDLLK